jgi:hypothetical protein
MENTKIFDYQEFNVISSSENCYKCRFKCEIILDNQKTINLTAGILEALENQNIVFILSFNLF